MLFDVLGTLVYDPFYLEVPAFFELSFEELLAQKHPTAWADFERAAISEETFLAGFFRDERAYDHAGLKRSMREAYRWLDGMEPLLRELAETGYEIHAFSNYPSWYTWIEERLELSRFLTWSFVSWNMRLRKPDPKIYQAALAALAAEGSECLFIDDREVNCAAARKCGITTIRYDGAAAVRAELVARGLI